MIGMTAFPAILPTSFGRTISTAWRWYIADAMARVPILARAGVQRVINGPIPYSPDGNPLIGPVRGLPDFLPAAASPSASRNPAVRDASPPLDC